MGSNTGSCCATPEREEWGSFCTETQRRARTLQNLIFMALRALEPCVCPAKALQSPKASQPSTQEVMLAFSFVNKI